ncbi:MAG: response regulator [Bryobacteraceae bacterium]
MVPSLSPMRSAASSHAQTPALILLVDDNCDGVVARRSVLEELGYKVICACCGAEALELAGKENFDLVITDYKMAPMDGIELIAKMRARGFEKPAILLVGLAEGLAFHHADTGADTVIQKSANEIAVLVRHTKRLLTPKKPAGSYAGAKKRALARGGER